VGTTSRPPKWIKPQLAGGGPLASEALLSRQRLGQEAFRAISAAGDFQTAARQRDQGTAKQYAAGAVREVVEGGLTARG
jgi:hypothetical protein